MAETLNEATRQVNYEEFQQLAKEVAQQFV